LTQAVSQQECAQLAEELQHQGWHEKFLYPLRHVTPNAVRIGLCLLDEPGLQHFVHGNGRVVLLGDAAHPPLPYIGQGAQLGMEDCGVLALLLKRYYLDEHDNAFSLQNLHAALELYEKMRIPRTREIRANGKRFGKRQE
jgi:salicylate hydroxylase